MRLLCPNRAPRPDPSTFGGTPCKPRFGPALCTIAAVTLPALAADNPWFGNWKLDPAKSHMTGDTFTYSKVAGGMDHYSNGPISFDFTANGIDYPVMANATTAWVASGPNQWKETDKTTAPSRHIRHQAHPEL